MGFRFEHRVEFRAAEAEEILREVPAAAGIVCLRGERAEAEPYLTRAADLRRRLRRLLAPPEALDANGLPVLSKRLNLRERVHSIEWTVTGSEFESLLLLYSATREAFGATAARKRLRLWPPYFVRLTATHTHPRVYVSNRLSARGLDESFGPFPSRAAAERYADAVLDLFKLRRCHEDLQVHPEHPGCAYGEMRMCLAPCKAAVTTAQYGDEAERVRRFLATRGESLLGEVAVSREQASEAMDFERAAELHTRWEKVRAAASLADELVRPLSELRAVVVQAAAAEETGVPASEAAVFLLEHGRLVGPERLSTLGVRAVREQTAVGSSLFAQPLMLAAVPLREESPGHAVEEGSGPAFGEDRQSAAGSFVAAEASSDLAAGRATVPHLVPTVVLSPEERAAAVLARLALAASAPGELDPGERGDVLALFRRWYYRPEKGRAGEVFLPNADGSWPVRRLLNGAARVVLGPPAALSPVDREAARAKLEGLKTKVIHPGREGVERVVAMLPKRSRTRKSVVPGDMV